jgi:hypothetical protein
MNQHLREAVGLWINTAVSLIPVWTGASHATFIKLAGKIGQTFSVGGINMPGFVGPAEGQRASQGRLTTWNGVYVAEYSTTLWHLIYNEYNDGNANKEAAHVYSRLIRPGPYGFQEQANAAFQAYTAANVSLPSPWTYITLVNRKV